MDGARIDPNLLKIGAAAVAIAIALVAWRILATEPRPGSDGGSPLAPRLTDHASRGAPSSPREVLVDRTSAEGPEAIREPAAATALPPEGKAEDSAVAAPAAATFSVLGRFVQPDHVPVQVESARVVATGKHGFAREVGVVQASTVLLEGLPPDVYSVRVFAPGFEHRDQVLDLASNAHRTELEERLILWPAGWLPVVVLTPDGRSFEELADELGIERKRLLVDAFDVRTRFDPPDEEAWDLAAVPQAAVWRKPPIYQSWSLPGACVGSLQLLEPRPFWVGLAVLDLPLGWEHVSPGDREVVFRLDAAMLEQRFATVRMRVVDAPGGSPRNDVRVTLKADTSAHRRNDQANVQPDSGGRVALARIVPGRYELTIESEGSLHQDLLDLGPGESRDLGDIVLRPGRTVQVRALDGQGRPVDGWVEIAPFRRGGRVRDLYPPNLHRSLDREGEFSLPLPSELSIVRVTLRDPDSGHQTSRVSQNVLLDPDHPPSGPLELVVREPIEVRFEIAPREGSRIDVVDELSLVVASKPAEEKVAPRFELHPGRYVARHLDPAGVPIGEAPFEILEKPLQVPLD
jgi:hypothetical protein